MARTSYNTQRRNISQPVSRDLEVVYSANGRLRNCCAVRVERSKRLWQPPVPLPGVAAVGERLWTGEGEQQLLSLRAAPTNTLSFAEKEI
jgi:hypothetical protein